MSSSVASAEFPATSSRRSCDAPRYSPSANHPTFSTHDDAVADAKPSEDSGEYFLIQRRTNNRRDTTGSRGAMHAQSDVSQQNGVTEQPNTLPPLQDLDLTDDAEKLKPILEDDPASYDLVAPGETITYGNGYSLDKRSLALFSSEHLQVIFADPALLLRFTTFLGLYRPRSVPVLVHYLDCLKAIRAIHYANAILEGLEPVDGLNFTAQAVTPTVNEVLEARAQAAFKYLADEELPAFITHEWIQVVSRSVTAKVTGSIAPRLRDASDGLAEVFCLTDPSRPDNPIVFASEEFTRMTQYGMNYILGKNCRFLQGPDTNQLSIQRLRDAVQAGRQHQEVFLNYRRDGSPFMNLLMMAPLNDNRGKIRYFIGAQVDVSELARDCTDMDSLQRLVDMQNRGEEIPSITKPSSEKDDELRELAEMMNQGEMSSVRKYGGRMHREVVEEDEESVTSQQPRLLLRDPSIMTPRVNVDSNGKLTGIYQHYLLIRPYPSLRILFASPSQRVPGILQSPFMNKIGGSNRVREELTAAFADGRGVTAKVRWVSRIDEEGRNKWIHCTPLVGINGQIGVWMVVLVDDEATNNRRWLTGKPAPPVATPDRSRTPAHPNAAFHHTNGHLNGRDDRDGSVRSRSGSTTSPRIY